MTHASTYYRQAREMRKADAIRQRLTQQTQENRTDAERKADEALEAQTMYREFLLTEL